MLWKIISPKCGYQAFSYTRPGKFGNINIFTLINEKLDFVFFQVTSNITFVWLFENLKTGRRLILLHSTTNVKMHAYLSRSIYLCVLQIHQFGVPCWDRLQIHLRNTTNSDKQLIVEFFFQQRWIKNKYKQNSTLLVLNTLIFQISILSQLQKSNKSAWILSEPFRWTQNSSHITEKNLT